MSKKPRKPVPPSRIPSQPERADRANLRGETATTAPLLSAREAPLIADPGYREPGRAFTAFWAGGEGATFLWPRWAVLRAVGLVYIFVFAGILQEAQAILGPKGVVPLDTYFLDLTRLFAGKAEAFFSAPTLFWFNSSATAISLLAGVGLLAAVALVFNLWPRMALFVCWLAFLSFVTTWGAFSPAQLDGLMLEAALLCIPFAPAGLRPGLGIHSPPHAITLFMMRWLLFRVTFGSGLVKLISEDPHWRDGTAMDVMYETSPSPTILGYWVHQLPHAYHLLEIGFTFMAELIGPLLALFAGRRGRWFAFWIWTALQIGIQLTCNFGWLNTAAIGLGLLFLDDQMVLAFVKKMGSGVVHFFTLPLASPGVSPGKTVWGYALRGALALHFGLTLFYFGKVSRLPVDSLPEPIAGIVKFFSEFRSANGYSLYANFEAGHYQVDFEGSADRGKTWRTYEFRHVPQQPDRMPPFLAPRFARFETTLEIQSSRANASSTVVSLVAAHLLVQNPEVVRHFRENPFPDRRPTVVRMRLYRLSFTNPATLRQTRNYWTKQFIADYAPALHLTEQGEIARFDLAPADAAREAGDAPAAWREYDRQYRLGNLDAGFRLAEMAAEGEGVPKDPGKAFALFSELAERGEVKAQHSLGVCYERGVGVPIDYTQAAVWYRRAADQGNLFSFYAFGALAAKELISTRYDREGLTLLLRAVTKATGDDPQSRFIREETPALIKRLLDRMSGEEIVLARKTAAQRR